MERERKDMEIADNDRCLGHSLIQVPATSGRVHGMTSHLQRTAAYIAVPYYILTLVFIYKLILLILVY